MADDHHDEDPQGAAARAFNTTMIGVVLFIAACYFIFL